MKIEISEKWSLSDNSMGEGEGEGGMRGCLISFFISVALFIAEKQSYVFVSLSDLVEIRIPI